MAALLQQELEASELAKLPKTIQSKLEKIVSDLRYEIDSLKAQHEQFRVDSGKLFPVILIASCAKVFGFAYSACMPVLNRAMLNLRSLNVLNILTVLCLLLHLSVRGFRMLIKAIKR